jgi:hypothetical protein
VRSWQLGSGKPALDLLRCLWGLFQGTEWTGLLPSLLPCWKAFSWKVGKGEGRCTGLGTNKTGWGSGLGDRERESETDRDGEHRRKGALCVWGWGKWGCTFG